MRHMRPILLSAFALTLLVVAGCTKPAGPTGPATSTGTGSADPGEDTGTSDVGVEVVEPGSAGMIGFSALTLKNPFFKIIADSITDEGTKHGYKVIVNDAENDVSKQSNHIDDYIAQEVTAIVINPAERLAIGAAVKRANEAGIPVFTCDLQCIAEDAKITGHIGTDNLGGGRLAGEAMIEVLGETGGEVLVLHFKKANSCVLRVRGFTEVIDAHNEGRESGLIEIVSELDGGGSRDKGYSSTSDALQAHPNLKGIFAINDPSGLGAWAALNEVDKTDAVAIVAFDGQLIGKRAILEGKIYADPIQFPKKMGVASVQNIVKYIDGEEFNEMELIPTELYRKADAEKDPELQTAEPDEVAGDPTETETGK